MFHFDGFLVSAVDYNCLWNVFLGKHYKSSSYGKEIQLINHIIMWKINKK